MSEISIRLFYAEKEREYANRCDEEAVKRSDEGIEDVNQEFCGYAGRSPENRYDDNRDERFGSG